MKWYSEQLLSLHIFDLRPISSKLSGFPEKKTHFGQNEGVVVPIPSSQTHPKKVKDYPVFVVQRKNWILNNKKSYEGFFQKLERALIF